MSDQIKLKDALEGMDMVLEDTPKEHRPLVEKEVESLLHYMTDGDGFLELEEVSKVFQSVGKAIQTGDYSILTTKTGLRWEPVPIVQFIEDPFFLGLRGQVWPMLLTELHDIFQGPNEAIIREVVLGGSIGSGKSFRAQLILAYQLYKLSCYHTPQLEYGLSSGSSIFMIFQSMSLTLARKVLFDQFSQMLRRGEYFQKYFPYDKSITTELRFPSDVTIMPVASGDTSALGLNVFTACFPPEQEYLASDGTFVRMDAGGCSPVLTYDVEGSVIRATDCPVESVLTGYKELYKVSFDNGEHIICTKDQKFMEDSGEWIAASNMPGRCFKFVDMQDMRSAGYISNTAFEKRTFDDWKGVSGDVSRGDTVYSEDDGDTEKKEISWGVGSVSSVRCGDAYDNRDTFEKTQHDSYEVSGAISKSDNEGARHCRGLFGKSTGACLRAEKSPCVYRGPARRYSEGSAPRTCKTTRVIPEPGVCCREVFSREGTVLKVVRIAESKYGISLYAGQGGCSGDGVQWQDGEVFSPGWHLIGTSFQTRVGVCFLVGFLGDSIQIRVQEASLPISREEENIYTRFRDIFRSYRGEGEPVVARRKDFNKDDCGTSDREHQVSYASNSSADGFGGVVSKTYSREGQRSDVPSTRRGFQPVLCMGIEPIFRKCAVYDLKNVPNTHAFFAKARSGVFIAHNCLDEVNFMANIENSSRAKFTGEAEYNQAQKLYSTITRRIKSRFNRRGKVPGKLCIMSSAHYPGDFVSTKKAEVDDYKAKGVPCPIYFSSLSQWEAKPVGTFSDETFLVEVGDDTRRSRIIQSKEEAIELQDVLEVPVDFLPDFQSDIDAAIRDIAGVPVGGVNLFIKDRESIVRSTKAHHKAYSGKQLFAHDSVDLNSFENLEFLLDKTYISDYLDSLNEYAIHVDLALTNDCAGLAVTHLGGWKDVGKSYDYDEKTGKVREATPGQKPLVVVDGALQIVPPMSDEIDINRIGDLIELIAAWIPLIYVTSDTFQSATLLQRMRRLRNYRGFQIKSSIVSVDKNLAPWMEVKQGLRDDRLILPDHPVLTKELRELKYDPKKQKADHPQGGGKDVGDAVAGGTYVIVAVNSGKQLKTKEVRTEVRRIRTGRPQIF